MDDPFVQLPIKTSSREHGWCIRVIAHIPPLSREFGSPTQSLVWVEFVVGSLPAPRVLELLNFRLVKQIY